MVDPPTLPEPSGAEGDEVQMLTEIASVTGVSVAELGGILDELLAEPVGSPADVEDADGAHEPLDAEALWRRVARLTWGDDTTSIDTA